MILDCRLTLVQIFPQIFYGKLKLFLRTLELKFEFLVDNLQISDFTRVILDDLFEV